MPGVRSSRPPCLLRPRFIAGFLQDELGLPGVDHNELYTVYTLMGWRIPGNLRSQLINARQRAGYFGSVSNGKSILSTAGENFARMDSLNGADDDTDSDGDEA